MTGRIWIWVMSLALLASVPPAFSQGILFSGRLCVIDLDENVLPDRPREVHRVQGTFDATKLCTGDPRPVVNLECRKVIENWPNRNLSQRNVPCQIDVSACGLPDELVDATSSILTINRNGSARLQCQYRIVGNRLE